MLNESGKSVSKTLEGRMRAIKNKTGKGETKAAIWVLGAVVLFLLYIAFGGKIGGTASVSTTGVPGEVSNGGIVVNAAIPTVAYAAVDKFQPSTTVGSYTQTVFKNGQLQSTAPTTASVGDKLEVLFVNGSTYHSGVASYVVSGGANTVPAQLKANGSLTISLRNTNGQVMSNSLTGATNQTSTASNGETLDLEIRMNGQNLKSTNDLVLVLETNSSTKYDMTATGTTLNIKDAKVSSRGVPASYSTLAGGAIKVYEISAFEDGNVNIGTLHLQAKAGQTLANTRFVLTAYSREHFVDPVNGLQYDIEDSNGVLKSIAVTTFNGAVN